jgi:hypothetical protein
LGLAFGPASRFALGEGATLRFTEEALALREHLEGLSGSVADYAARLRFGRTTARTASNSRSAALTLAESGKALASSASRIRALRPRAYGLRRALDQSFTSGISRRDAAEGSLAFVDLALMGGCLAGADDSDNIVRFNLNIHHDQDSCPRRRAEDQQPVVMDEVRLDQSMFVVEDGRGFFEWDGMLAQV